MSNERSDESPQLNVFRGEESVSNPVDPRVRRALDAIATSKFNTGSFERLVSKRQFVLSHDLEVHGVVEDAIEEKLHAAWREIETILRAHNAIFTITDDVAAKLIDMSDGVAAAVTARRFPELQQQAQSNIQKYIEAFCRLYVDIVPSSGRVSREALDREMMQRGSIRSLGSDATQLIVYERNRLKTIPDILAVPLVEQKPYNPFYALVEKQSTVLTASLARFLKLFEI